MPILVGTWVGILHEGDERVHESEGREREREMERERERAEACALTNVFVCRSVLSDCCWRERCTQTSTFWMSSTTLHWME